MVRSFCPICGTQVLSAADESPHLVVIRAGTLDSPELAAPEGVIWTASAPSWACIDARLPLSERQPEQLPAAARS